MFSSQLLFDISPQVLVFFLQQVFRHAPGQTTSTVLGGDCSPLNPAFLPLAWVGQHCCFTLHSPYPLCSHRERWQRHLTSERRQTTSPSAALRTTPGTWEGSATCPQSTIPPAPAISCCGTVLRASICVTSGCICHPTHLNLDFGHPWLLPFLPEPIPGKG